MGESRPDPLVARLDGRVLYLTLNRPNVLNALNQEVLRLLELRVDTAASNGDISVIVLEGSGDRAFSVGADLDELSDVDPLRAHELLSRGHRVFRAIETINVPTIAVLNGLALGGGLELALACSLIFASQEARLGFPEIGLGLMPGYGGTQRLPRLIGTKAALRLMLTGEQIDAREAYELGLLSAKPLPADELITHVVRVADRIANYSRSAAMLILQAVRTGENGFYESGLNAEAALAALAMSSPDAAEGIAAFREKRPPKRSGL